MIAWINEKFIASKENMSVKWFSPSGTSESSSLSPLNDAPCIEITY